VANSATSCEEHLPIWHLNGYISIQQLPSFESIDASISCKLHKALYGFKQALVAGSTGSQKPLSGLIFTQVYGILTNIFVCIDDII
jgi:hypothetical protein